MSSSFVAGFCQALTTACSPGPPNHLLPLSFQRLSLDSENGEVRLGHLKPLCLVRLRFIQITPSLALAAMRWPRSNQGLPEYTFGKRRTGVRLESFPRGLDQDHHRATKSPSTSSPHSSLPRCPLSLLVSWMDWVPLSPFHRKQIGYSML